MSHRHPRRGQAGGALNGPPPHRQAPVPGLLPVPPRSSGQRASQDPGHLTAAAPRPEATRSGTRGGRQLPRSFLGRD